MSNFYDFIKGQWELRVFDAERLARCVEKGFITQAQADEIMACGR